MKDGETKDHRRWCESCGHFHGVLYLCNGYPVSVISEINNQRRDFEEYVKNMKSSPEKTIFEFFMGKRPLK